MNAEKNHALDQAKAQLESIIEMVDQLEKVREDDDTAQHKHEDEIEEAERAIHEDPLSVEVRSDWHEVGADDSGPTEFNILLCTGGPAVRIIGDLNKYLEPENPRLQYQDWGTPWTEYRITAEQEEKVLTYCRQFYFGE